MTGEKKKKAILLLMNLADAEFFASRLRPFAPDSLLVHVPSLDYLDEISQRPDFHMRLIAFCTGTVVPARIVERLAYNCFNFHPGPPERPGYMPAPFALRERARDYGVTFHFMTPRVDEGEIVEVTRFTISEGDDQEAIETKAYKALLAMVIRRAANLADVDFRFTPGGEKWSGIKTTRKDLEKLMAAS